MLSRRSRCVRLLPQRSRRIILGLWFSTLIFGALVARSLGGPRGARRLARGVSALPRVYESHQQMETGGSSERACGRSSSPCDWVAATRGDVENVPRLAESKKGKRRFRRLLRDLEDLGFKMSWTVVDAADFGSPQHRRRLIVYGAKREIIFPSPRFGPRSQSRRPGKPQRMRSSANGSQSSSVGRIETAKAFALGTLFAH